MTASDIIAATARRYGLRTAAIVGHCKTQVVVEARWMAMVICRDVLGLSYPSIGLYFNCHHTTALYGYAKFVERAKQGPQLRATLSTVVGDLQDVVRRSIAEKTY
jgi:chromosomal replication initiator protein